MKGWRSTLGKIETALRERVKPVRPGLPRVAGVPRHVAIRNFANTIAEPALRAKLLDTADRMEADAKAQNAKAAVLETLEDRLRSMTMDEGRKAIREELLKQFTPQEVDAMAHPLPPHPIPAFVSPAHRPASFLPGGRAKRTGERHAPKPNGNHARKDDRPYRDPPEPK